MSELPHRLAYKDRELSLPPQNVADAQSFIDNDYAPIQLPPNNSSVFYTILKLTGREFTAIYSALLTGAQLMYPDQYGDILLSFLRNFEYPIPVSEIMNCDDVLACVTPEYINNVVNNTINQRFEELLTQITNQFSRQIEPPTGVSCEDANWGAITTLVDGVHARITDIWEQFEVATNEVDFVDVLSNTTIINETSIGVATGFIQFIQDNFVENYASQWTTGLRDEICCELFCATTDCIVTIDDVYNYFAEKLGSLVSGYQSWSLLDLATDIVDGEFAGNAIVYGSWFIYFGLQKLGNYIFRTIGQPTWSEYVPLIADTLKLIELGADNPSNDWIILCECANMWEHTFDFTVSQSGWVSHNTNWAEWVTGLGWRRNSAVGGRITIKSPTYTGNVTRISATYSRQNVVLSSQGSVQMRNSASATLTMLVPASTAITNYVIDTNYTITASYTLLDHALQNVTTTPQFPSDLYLKTLTLRGTGANPFV